MNMTDLFASSGGNGVLSGFVLAAGVVGITALAKAIQDRRSGADSGASSSRRDARREGRAQARELNQARVLAGSPSGGQFAPHSRSESDIELDR